MDDTTVPAPGRRLDRRTLLKGSAALAAAGTLGPAGLWRPRPARAAELVPASTMRTIYEQVKTPSKYGMVLPPPSNGHFDSPSVFRSGSTWYMLFIVFHASGTQGYETRLASSTDLLTWTQRGTVLPFRPGQWDAAQAAGYVALQDVAFGGSNTIGQHAGRYWLSYLGGSSTGYEAGALSIGMANTTTPTAATPWTRLANPVLGPDDPTTRYWETNKLYKSNVIRDPNNTLGAPFVMFYNAVGEDGGSNAGVERIGIAKSQDMVTWTRHGIDPVLSPDGSFANRVVGDPQVVKIGDVWVMFFWARYDGDRGTRVFNSFACSYDLVTWNKWRGEVLMTTTRPFERSSAHKPWIVKHNGVVYQYYSAVGDQGFGIAVATSEDLRAAPGSVRASASYTFVEDSPAAAIDGVISYDDTPRSRWTAYASPNASDWLEVRFPATRNLSAVTLHVFTDADAMHPPRSYNVEYLTSGGWRAVPGQTRSPGSPVAGVNTTTFPTVSTDRFRVFFDHPGGGTFSGVTEVQYR